MTLKQILRRAPKEAVSLYYAQGKCKFFASGTHQYPEFLDMEYDYQTSYREARFLADKVNGKWVTYSIFSECQISNLLRVAESYAERNAVSPEAVIHAIMNTLQQ